MVLFLEQILEPRKVPLLPTKTAQRFTTLRQTSSKCDLGYLFWFLVIEVNVRSSSFSTYVFWRSLTHWCFDVCCTCISCCGAGTAADTENTTNNISSQLELHRLRTDRESRVATACRLLKQMLYKYQGHVSAALVLGGVDINGPALYSIYPHGSVDKLPYVTMGSGSLAAMGVFEDGFKPDMDKEEVQYANQWYAVFMSCSLQGSTDRPVRPFREHNIAPVLNATVSVFLLIVEMPLQRVSDKSLLWC